MPLASPSCGAFGRSPWARVKAISSAILSGDCLHLKNLREPTAFSLFALRRVGLKFCKPLKYSGNTTEPRSLPIRVNIPNASNPTQPPTRGVPLASPGCIVWRVAPPNTCLRHNRLPENLLQHGGLVPQTPKSHLRRRAGKVAASLSHFPLG